MAMLWEQLLALVAVVLVFDRLGSSLRDLAAPDSAQA